MKDRSTDLDAAGEPAGLPAAKSPKPRPRAAPKAASVLPTRGAELQAVGEAPPGARMARQALAAASPAPTPAPTPQAQTLAQADPWLAYQTDCFQRSVLFLDVLRTRANTMLAHEQAGLPPVLDFRYETIVDARRFERPANYALLRITGCGEDHAEDRVDPQKRPVIILDPRAGHGPGIGGLKRESEVGIALHEGYPVYFVSFFPEPCEGQTLTDVLFTLRRFVAEVARRHDGAAPALYGNCQAGWAAMLLAASCQGLAGPTVLNGSPLSYWAGAADVNPMRLAGGLTGGAWLTHLLADLGDGRFDGAWLVQNFESLNPANTLWEKNYALFANVEGERERFLEFEKWWSGYYFLTREEIVSIVENLFIGDKLERGEMRLDSGCTVNLRHVRNPLVIFASSGDNITPPHQALNWIPTVYEDTAALRQAGQRIVYLLNTHVGHLGIFVSAAVARLEHRAILENLDKIEALPPGLYEMKIEGSSGQAASGRAPDEVRFEPREVSDIRYPYAQKSFEAVRRTSETLEAIYSSFASPLVQAFASPATAAALKWLHPMRVSRYMFSEKLNPWMRGIALLAQAAAQARQPVPQDNPFRKMEGAGAQMVAESLEQFRRLRDASMERTFTWLYPG